MNASARLEALGTGVTLAVTEAADLGTARAVVEHELACIDLACSRFRSDSELSRLNGNAGQWLHVSALLMEALEVALRAAALTDGLVDPTIGLALIQAGYDRDFADVDKNGPPLRARGAAVPGYRQVRLDRTANRAWIPRGAALDLGSTAKALAADRAAAAVAEVTGKGALVSCGGDLAAAGTAPGDGWTVQVSAHHADPFVAEGETIAIRGGGVATSGTVARHWRRGNEELHHIVDPRTGRPAASPWQFVTVVGSSCVDANIASTAAIILGERAPSWLEEKGLPARLVGNDGAVVRVAGWPD